MPENRKPKTRKKRVLAALEDRCGDGAAPVHPLVGGGSRKAGPILIEARLIQKTQNAIFVVQGDDVERGVWLWNRNFEHVETLAEGVVRIRVDRELAAARGLFGLSG